MKRIILAILLLSLAANVIDARPVHAVSNVIYGHSTGLSADTTIRQVSFSRSEDNLVAVFQVNGQISNSYQYGIAILFSPSYNPVYTYSFNYNGPLRGSFFSTSPTGTATPIQYTIQGDTWTAWVPLSLIGGRTHFWVWVGISYPRPSTSLYSQWIDFLPSITTYSTLNYEIGLPSKVTFTLQPNSLAGKAVLSIDGSPHNFDSGGSLSVMVDSSVSHAMSITSPIQISNDTRYIVSWGGIAYSSQNANSNTLNVDQDSSITVSFQRQFLLTVKSDVGNVSGGGWYNEGSTASFSISSQQLPYDGFLGKISLQHQFTGWGGDVVSNVASSSISMDGPKTVTANWKTVGGTLFVGIVGLIVAMSLVAVFILYRRGTIDFKLPSSMKRTRRKTRRVKRTQTVTASPLAHRIEASGNISDVKEAATPTVAKTTMFCIQCGAVIPRSSKFCKECGNKLTE